MPVLMTSHLRRLVAEDAAGTPTIRRSMRVPKIPARDRQQARSGIRSAAETSASPSSLSSAVYRGTALSDVGQPDFACCPMPQLNADMAFEKSDCSRFAGERPSALSP